MSSEKRPRRPDFFIVGAPKCGTTAMTHYLDAHPEIYFPPDKEFHYFGSDIEYEDVFRNVREEKEYFAQFENAGPDQLVGETSTMNLYSERAAAEIHEYDSNAKIIMMLRNPVDMIHSLHQHYLYGGNETIEGFEEALEAEQARKQGQRLPETVRFREGLYYREVANYAEQVRRYQNVFDEQQLHVIIFDDFAEETREVYSETLAFLGIQEDFEPEFERINPSKKVLSQRLNRLVREPPPHIKWIVQILDRNLPAWLFRNPVRWLYRQVNTRPEERDPIDPELRRSLAEEFHPMIEELEVLIERDLSKWKTPETEPRGS